MTTNDTTKNAKKLTGTVVSVNMDKTAKVAVDRFVKHPKYLKYIKKGKQYLVHDPDEAASVGDTVVMKETAPIAKNKHFVLTEVKEI